MSNSPHPLLFAPIARRMRELGHEVGVTARDNAQTVELTLERFPEAAVFGSESPRSRAGKARALTRRVRSLMGWAKAFRPDVALSHNSYAQIVAARAAGVPVVTAMDYEGQPANHLAFRLADAVLVPETMPSEILRRQGANGRKLRRYPGFKEEIYLGDFVPDPNVLDAIGPQLVGRALVVARTPPSRAAYHRFGNPLFGEALESLGAEPDVMCVVLARHAEQREAVTAMGFPNLVVPDRAVDSRSLMYRADLVLGAGGTMTREAALMGVRTFSVFAGAQPAVDRELERRGLIARLRCVSELTPVASRQAPPSPVGELRANAETIASEIISAVEEAAARKRRHGRGTQNGH